MKSFVDEYSIDYRNDDDVSSDEDVLSENNLIDLDKDEIKSKNIFRKLLAVTLLFLSVTGVAYEVMQNPEAPMLSNSTVMGGEREYDDFIFPLVMQDPPPFSCVEEVDPIILVSSSIWQIVMSKKIDEFDSEGRAVVHMKEMWEGYDYLFGSSYHPSLPEKINNDFFSFDIEEEIFHINPTTNQKCYIPYTENLSTDGEDVVLKVGYVSPNDKWRSLKNERPEKPTPVKFLDYRLVKCDDSVRIKSVVSA